MIPGFIDTRPLPILANSWRRASTTQTAYTLFIRQRLAKAAELCRRRDHRIIPAIKEYGDLLALVPASYTEHTFALEPKVFLVLSNVRPFY
jgi:hypothetical protein